jgi:hypothetical protein
VSNNNKIRQAMKIEFTIQKDLNKKVKTTSKTIGGTRALLLSIEAETKNDGNKAIFNFLRASKKDEDKYKQIVATIKPSNSKSIREKGSEASYSIWGLITAVRTILNA